MNRFKATMLATVLVFSSFGNTFAADEWMTRESPHNVATTVERFAAAVEKAGAKVFARIDHAAGAQTIGAELEPTVLVLFGNPKLGTPILQANRKAGMDLPMRLLVWSEDGKTMMGAVSPAALQARYGIVEPQKPFKMMSGAINKLMDAVASN